jgi:hypothetical protein
MTKAFKLQKHYAQFISEEYLLNGQCGYTYCAKRLDQELKTTAGIPEIKPK